MKVRVLTFVIRQCVVIDFSNDDMGAWEGD